MEIVLVHLPERCFAWETRKWTQKQSHLGGREVAAANFTKKSANLDRKHSFSAGTARHLMAGRDLADYRNSVTPQAGLFGGLFSQFSPFPNNFWGIE